MLYGNITVHVIRQHNNEFVALGFGTDPTPLDLKTFRQDKLASAVARGCFQRSPAAVTFGLEAGKNTIIDTGRFPTEGLEIHCPSFLLLRCLCFHILVSFLPCFFLIIFSPSVLLPTFPLSSYASFLTLLASLLVCFLFNCFALLV
jgi:hypothetical protein